MPNFVVFLVVGLFSTYIPTAVAISCHQCDITVKGSYTAANDKCNAAGSLPCPSDKNGACMLEAYLPSSDTVQLMKTCRPECPLFINTSAEVVRCCTRDDCNNKFEPVPTRPRPVYRPPGQSRFAPQPNDGLYSPTVDTHSRFPGHAQSNDVYPAYDIPPPSRPGVNINNDNIESNAAADHKNTETMTEVIVSSTLSPSPELDGNIKRNNAPNRPGSQGRLDSVKVTASSTAHDKQSQSSSLSVHHMMSLVFGAIHVLLAILHTNAVHCM